MTPDATWQQWLQDPEDAFQAVAQHAASVGSWGTIEWLVVAAGVVAGVLKVAKYLPLPPLVATGVAWAESWLPRLTGRREAKVQHQAQRITDTAAAAVEGIDHALGLLKEIDPHRAEQLVAALKERQEALGIREETRALIKALRAAQDSDDAEQHLP